MLVSPRHELLRTVLPEFDFSDASLNAREIVDTLVKCMKEHNGYGISANQIGLNHRVFVMGIEDPIACFNPIITSYSDDMIYMEEGCLTYPSLFVKIKRSSTIRVRYQDVNGETITRVLNGISARVFQHEHDHLEGIHFTERASRIHLNRAKKQQEFINRKRKKVSI